ncbi:TPA: hypothetical protein DIC40_05890 [Patescibacteria group bacterium]|nr:hypothetical protein [Candidatus Gracilibacteria bacterium]
MKFLIAFVYSLCNHILLPFYYNDMVEKQVEVSYSFYNVPGYKQTLIKDIVDKNIDGKLDAYLKKVYTKKDAEIRLNYKIQKNKQGRYEAKFLFDCD